MTKIVQYDLPSLKREIKSTEKTITEALNKLEGFHKSEKSARATFLKECGNRADISEHELISLLRLNTLKQVQEIVPLYQKIEETLRTAELKECLDYQEQYLLFFEMEQGLQTREATLLRYFSQQGNTTLSLRKELKRKKLKDGISQKTKELENKKYEVYQIQEPLAELELVDASEAWEVVNVEEGEESKVEQVEGSEEESCLGEQAGRTILGCVRSRKSLESELIALEAFLESRIFQLQPSRDPQSFAVYEQGKPDLLNKESTEYVRKLLKPVSTALQIMKSQQLRHLHRLETDASYVDEILSKTLQHRDRAEKYKEKGAIVEQRIETLRKELEENKKEAQKLKARKEQLFERLERDVQGLFPGVEIKILL